jgi:uncharacterized membrane protein YhaH (DUF805 family)
MFKTPSSAASEKPNPRVHSLGGLILVLCVITGVNNGLEFHHTWSAVFHLVLSPLAAWIWVGWTMQCLRNLGLSRLWVLPILLPPIAFAVAFHKSWIILSLVALVVMVAVQIIIVIWKPTRELKPINIPNSDRPPA